MLLYLLSTCYVAGTLLRTLPVLILISPRTPSAGTIIIPILQMRIQRLRNVYYLSSHSDYMNLICTHLVWLSSHLSPPAIRDLVSLSVSLMPSYFPLPVLAPSSIFLPPLHSSHLPLNASCSRKSYLYLIIYSLGSLHFHLEHLWGSILLVTLNSISISSARLRLQDVSHPTVWIIDSLVTHHSQVVNHQYGQFPSARF